MPTNVMVRDLEHGEEAELWHLYRNTIHSINSQHYSSPQVEAWAPSNFDSEIWRQKIRELSPFVVEENSKVIGYADLQASGLIDHFFVHHKWQRKGVGTMLMQEIELRAKKYDLSKLEAHVSITARDFFEAFQFSVVSEQEIEVRGEKLTNFIMRRKLWGT